MWTTYKIQVVLAQNRQKNSTCITYNGEPSTKFVTFVISSENEMDGSMHGQWTSTLCITAL